MAWTIPVTQTGSDPNRLSIQRPAPGHPQCRGKNFKFSMLAQTETGAEMLRRNAWLRAGNDSESASTRRGRRGAQQDGAVKLRVPEGNNNLSRPRNRPAPLQSRSRAEHPARARRIRIRRDRTSVRGNRCRVAGRGPFPGVRGSVGRRSGRIFLLAGARARARRGAAVDCFGGSLRVGGCGREARKPPSLMGAQSPTNRRIIRRNYPTSRGRRPLAGPRAVASRSRDAAAAD